jgi:hypothetical protein
MDWFIARNGKVDGPLTLEALVDAVRLRQLGLEDHIWQPGADRWQRADDVPELWLPPLEPPPLDRKRTAWSKRATWLQAAAVALIVSGSALLVSFTIMGSIDTKQPRPAKLDCSLEGYLQGRCR